VLVCGGRGIYKYILRFFSHSSGKGKQRLKEVREEQPKLSLDREKQTLKTSSDLSLVQKIQMYFII